ncbi:alpha-methylacyl-CoA racemase [Actinomadura sp. NBRC 104425]|uniref:CaiB/BaiF CoA transferase family protein n=1 Tax=Actinomadura sp. NBRC 104425 TaxID=3032204 RepID=UPI0024A59A78|nr:CoA transferase [Actinomadura sp. NBRC 104425]GLZ15782.1 alpha-methylacyl-CoA racemase [Actinomadura sp. NBRC 104425]
MPDSAAHGATPPQPLSGIRVIELAHWMAGPAAGGVLQDWGAEVIKVEPEGGEPMRHIWGSMGANPDAPNGAFVSANRGKKSIELDVRSDEGRDTLHALLDDADVLLTNLRPGALSRLGLSPEEVAERHPRLVYCSLTAYGWGGPDQDKAGYDLASFFGRTGIAHEITTQGTPPAALLQGLGDTFSAMTAVAGTLAALLEREHTGKGRLVEASLMRTGMWALAGELGVQAMGGHPKPPKPRDKSSMPMYNSYRTKDDRWFYLVGVQAGRQLPKVLAAIGRPELMEDERFNSARAIAKNRAEFIPILDEAFAAKTLAEWDEIFTEHDVFWAPVQTPAEVVDDPQARAVGAWIRIEELDAESVDSPIRFDRIARSSAPRPPRSGEQTEEILGRLRAED